MLARDAESLFWTGRYLERAEDTARLLDVTYHGLLEATAAEQRVAWRGVLAAAGLDQAFSATGREPSANEVAEYLVLDADNPGSIVSAVIAARDNVRTVRESLSTEFWEALNSFCLDLRMRDLTTDLDFQPHEFYGFVRRNCQAVAGVAGETLARDEGWRFLTMGWNLERAEWTCRLLRVRQVHLGDVGFHEWVGTLRAASGIEAYRRAYRASMEPSDVLEFLLLSPVFPRSAFFAVRVAEEALRAVDVGPDVGRALRLLGRLRAELEFADAADLMAGRLDDELVRMEQTIRQVCSAIAAQFFVNGRDHDLHSFQVLPGELAS